MRPIFIAAIATLACSGAWAEEYPAQVVKDRCAEQFPGDFFMQQGCVDLQRDSFDNMTTGVQGLPADVADQIANKCRADFGQDFFMTRGCIDLQADSWRSLNQ